MGKNGMATIKLIKDSYGINKLMCLYNMIKGEDGQALLEYALLISLIGIVFIAAVPHLTTAFKSYFSRVALIISFPTP